MPEIILHHYDMSPFAEKARLMLGYKRLSWKSVHIPRVMPKPDVVALTGGYRRTPILQVGADIYCDTTLIAQKLEQLAPTPTLFPAAHLGALHGLCQWADAVLFQAAVVIAFQPPIMAKTFSSEEEMKTFIADRAAMRKGTVARRMPLAEAKAALNAFLQKLEGQFLDGRKFLFGDAPTIADFSVYHPLWFLRVRPALAPLLSAQPNLSDWLDRIAGIGHGSFTELSSGEAIAVANRSTPLPIESQCDAEGFAVGDRVEILPTDYGLDPVVGDLMLCNVNELALWRRDPRAGEVVVHFPRLNYELRKPMDALAQ